MFAFQHRPFRFPKRQPQNLSTPTYAHLLCSVIAELSLQFPVHSFNAPSHLELVYAVSPQLIGDLARQSPCGSRLPKHLQNGMIQPGLSDHVKDIVLWKDEIALKTLQNESLMLLIRSTLSRIRF